MVACLCVCVFELLFARVVICLFVCVIDLFFAFSLYLFVGLLVVHDYMFYVCVRA